MAAPDPQALAPKLVGVQVGLRKDLQVARHVFRDDVTYTVRDPISFETHAFAASDYAVLVAINGDRTLGATFEALVRDGVAQPDQAERFYKFILALHRSGLLSLPISDDRSLVMRYESRLAHRRKARWLAALYWKVPIWNPDAFLVKTLAFGSKLYTRSALIVWSILIAAALVSLIGRGQNLGAELPTLIGTDQVVSMWILLVALKVVHEFGHAYACRKFGGVVPEMGVTLVMMTPCAYVDASASWNFTRTRDRLIVCLGGIYFESWIAAMAAIFWAFTEPSMLHSIAYQTMVLASVTTIGFNINPLMRFDGYFITSDLLQVPNLRAQASDLATRWIKRATVGVDPGGPSWSPAMAVALLTYAVAAAIYRVGVVLGMCAVIAMKFFALGMAIGLFYGGVTLVKMLYASIHYLLLDPETFPVRPRAILVAAILLLVPAVVVSIPFPRTVAAQALVRREHEHIVTADSSGFVRSIAAEESQRVERGSPLVELTSFDIESDRDRACAESSAARLAVEASAAQSPSERSIAAEQFAVAEVRRIAAEQARDRLVVRSPADGMVMSRLDDSSRGRFVQAGTTVAMVADGRWMASTLVDQLDLSSLRLQDGDEVELRPVGESDRSLRGRIVSVAPAGDVLVEPDLHALTLIGGGDISVSPVSGRADSSRFVVRIAINDMGGAALVRGERLALRLPANRSSLAAGWYHAVLRFRERLAATE